MLLVVIGEKRMKALIAMSGGVDSSVAALMMKNAGYECIGCTMKLYDNDRHEILNETDKETVYEDLYQWMIKKLTLR